MYAGLQFCNESFLYCTYYFQKCRIVSDADAYERLTSSSCVYICIYHCESFVFVCVSLKIHLHNCEQYHATVTLVELYTIDTFVCSSLTFFRFSHEHICPFLTRTKPVSSLTCRFTHSNKTILLTRISNQCSTTS